MAEQIGTGTVAGAEQRRVSRTAGSQGRGAALGSLTFIGTATMLIRYGDLTLLTDPNFLHKGEQVRLGYGLRSTRRTDPAMAIGALPRLDGVVLSHLHEDHFDRVAERELSRSLPIITTPSAAARLAEGGFREARGLDTWQEHELRQGQTRARITSMPGRHGPGPLTYLLPSVMGSMLELQHGDERPFRMYITGDTLVHDALHEIPRRYPEIDLAVLHLGGTRIFGLTLTMTGRDGVQALRIVRPTAALPIHYNDYPVFKSPLSDFRREVERAGLPARVRYLRHGQSLSFGPGADTPKRPRTVSLGVVRLSA